MLMSPHYRHYGWECSPYSSKTRAYLRYKQIPFEDNHPTLIGMKRVIERKVGFIVMPVVVTPDGSAIQDTSDIIDHFEAEFPERSIWPQSPTQHLAAALLELFADEWVPLIAMHTRWDLPANRKFITGEFGRCAMPWLPEFLSRRLARPMANKMSSYLPVLGITAATRPAIDAWANELLDTLDDHLAEHHFLLGGQPCIGDFAMYGPLYAHLWRDPGSRQMVESRRHLHAWIQRLREPAALPPGQYLAADAVPAAVVSILTRMFKEQFPVLRRTVDAVSQWLDDHPGSARIPRGLGETDFALGGVTSTRKILSFQQWMLQRPLDYYQALDADARAPVDAFLKTVGGLDAMQIKLRHRLTRRQFRVVPEH